MELKSGHQFYHIGLDKKSMAGVGFLIHRKWSKHITEVRGINERLAQVTLKLNKKYSIKIIQVYAPTTAHEDEEVDKLYEEIAELLKTSKIHYNMAIGDFNAKVGLGQDGEEDVMGKFGLGTRNDRGDKLIEFAISNKLKIMNTFFKKSASRRWTWRSPNGKTKNEIDFILTNKPNIIHDVKVLNKVNTGSDHRMLLCKMKIDTRLERQKLLRPKHRKADLENLKTKKEEFQLELKNRFQALQEKEDTDLDNWNDQLLDIIEESALQVAGKARKEKESKISDSTKQLLEKRRYMKRDGIGIQNIEYSETCKTIRKKMREDIRKFNTRKIKETIENNRSLKKTNKKLSDGNQKIITLLDKNGQEIRDQDLILQRLGEFYEQFYQSDKKVEELQQETNEEMPDVTSWEVNHALNSMKRGKAPGTDNVIIDGRRKTPSQDSSLSFSQLVSGRKRYHNDGKRQIWSFSSRKETNETSKTTDPSACSQMCTSFSQES
ncbi:uncharacterized protein [Amphiura filiformis]|uniref:uncharacterized protein n=1 Tax=Amphiura filiformis TaxID=82378 RepID=UPI003B21C964